MHYDEFLEIVGGFGRYQKIQYFLICIAATCSVFYSMSMVFVCPTPEHHCDLQPWLEQANQTRNTYSGGNSLHAYSEEVNGHNNTPFSINTPSSENTPSSNNIHIGNLPLDHPYQSFKDLLIPSENPSERHCYVRNVSDVKNINLNNTYDVITCPSGWWYSKEFYEATAVSEWDLVCSSRWMAGMASSSFFLGRLIGALVSGLMADRFGRKPVLLVSVVILTSTGMAVAMSHNYWMFCVMYMCQGVGQVALGVAFYVHATELVAPQYRNIVGVFLKTLDGVGQLILVVIAYHLRHWRHIMITISLPPVLFFSYYWLIPESTRWLLSQGRKKEAAKIITRMMKMNKGYVDTEIVNKITGELAEQQQRRPSRPNTQRRASVVDLVNTRKSAKLSLIIWGCWFVNSIVYYGLSLNSSRLHGDPYLNFALLAVVEIPSTLIAIPLLSCIGRRKLMVISMFFAGVGCLGCAFVPVSIWGGWLNISLVLLGKFWSTTSYCTIYLMAAEVFPTVLRANGLAISSACARMGGLLAPQLLSLAVIYPKLPLIIFGVLSTTWGVVCLALPETSGQPLPETIREMHILHAGKEGGLQPSVIPEVTPEEDDETEPGSAEEALVKHGAADESQVTMTTGHVTSASKENELNNRNLLVSETTA